jgi:hypothetical protein
MTRQGVKQKSMMIIRTPVSIFRTYINFIESDDKPERTCPAQVGPKAPHKPFGKFAH